MGTIEIWWEIDASYHISIIVFFHTLDMDFSVNSLHPKTILLADRVT